MRPNQNEKRSSAMMTSSSLAKISTESLGEGSLEPLELSIRLTASLLIPSMSSRLENSTIANWGCRIEISRMRMSRAARRSSTRDWTDRHFSNSALMLLSRLVSAGSSDVYTMKDLNTDITLITSDPILPAFLAAASTSVKRSVIHAMMAISCSTNVREASPSSTASTKDVKLLNLLETGSLAAKNFFSFFAPLEDLLDIFFLFKKKREREKERKKKKEERRKKKEMKPFNVIYQP